MKDKGLIKHYVFITILMLALFLNFTMSNDYISLLVTVISAGYVMIIRKKYVVPAMVFFSFFAYLFVYNQFSLYIFICLAFVLRMAVSNTKSAKYVLALFVVYVAFHLASLNISGVSIGTLIPFFALLCLPLASTLAGYFDKDVVYSHYLLGFFQSSILAFFRGGTRLSEVLASDFLSVHDWMDTYRFSGLSYDANFYTMLSFFALAILLFGLRNTSKRYVTIVSIIATIALGALTYSKSGIIAYVLLLSIAAFCGEKSTRKKVLQLLSLAAIVMVMFSNQFDSIIGNILSRFTGITNINQFSSGRFDLWTNYLEKITDGPFELLVGHGMGSVEGMKAAHNTFIEITYKFGLLGFFTDIVALRFSFKLLCRSIGDRRSTPWPVKGVFIVFVGLIFNLSAYTFYSLWVCLLIYFLLSRRNDMRAV